MKSLVLFNNKGGLVSYLATDDIRKVEKAVAAGNKSAELVYRALVALQVALALVLVLVSYLQPGSTGARSPVPAVLLSIDTPSAAPLASSQ